MMKQFLGRLSPEGKRVRFGKQWRVGSFQTPFSVICDRVARNFETGLKMHRDASPVGEYGARVPRTRAMMDVLAQLDPHEYRDA